MQNKRICTARECWLCSFTRRAPMRSELLRCNALSAMSSALELRINCAYAGGMSEHHRRRLPHTICMCLCIPKITLVAVVVSVVVFVDFVSGELCVQHGIRLIGHLFVSDNREPKTTPATANRQPFSSQDNINSTANSQRRCALLALAFTTTMLCAYVVYYIICEHTSHLRCRRSGRSDSFMRCGVDAILGMFGSHLSLLLSFRRFPARIRPKRHTRKNTKPLRIIYVYSNRVA